MDFFKMASDVESLDELGFTYEELQPSAPTGQQRRRPPSTALTSGDGTTTAEGERPFALAGIAVAAGAGSSHDLDSTGGPASLSVRQASSLMVAGGRGEDGNAGSLSGRGGSGPSSSSQYSARLPGRPRGPRPAIDMPAAAAAAGAMASPGGAWEDSSETTTTDYATYPSSLGPTRRPRRAYPVQRPHNVDGTWGAATGSSSTGNDVAGAGVSGRRQSATDVSGGEGGEEAAGPSAVGSAYHHTRDNSLGFTFSGQPTDVVRFRSCIPPNMTRSRGGAEGAPPPEQRGPFPADILNVVLLFVDASSMKDIVETSRVCRFWRYYANYAPHWTYFRRKRWSSKEDRLAQYIRAIVAKPKIMTREEFFMERRRVEEYQRRDRIIDRVKHIRWCVATAIMAGVMITANFVVAYSLGFLRTALRSDAKLGATTAVVLTAMTLLEVTVVMVPLGGVSTPSSKDGMIRILCWGLVILDVGIVLGTISALAFTRVQANGHVLDGPTLDFAMDAECGLYPSRSYPSFTLLPAFLWDLRWRPITTDPLREKLEPACFKKPNDDRPDATQCYVLLYFDAQYISDVFQNKTMLDRYRDVGNTTAMGFDPFTKGKPILGPWCAAYEVPQVVAVTATTYQGIVAQRDAAYPRDADWLNPELRPYSTGAISHRCSSDINREATEDPRGSADIWFQYSSCWKNHYVPLVTTLRQLRSTFQETHDHFLQYAFNCFIISACLWGVELLGQCIVRAAAIDLLGATATATLVLFNPLSLIVSGMLCVFVDGRDIMCDDGSGYGLIGAGVGLFLLAATVFVVFYD